MRKPLSFGFLVNDVLSRYQARLLSGMERAAARRDIRLITFAGGYLSPDYESGGFDGSVLFAAARRPAVDGLIVEGSILATEVGSEAVVRLCRTLEVPFVSIGELPDTTSVTVDEHSGVRRMVHHLVTAHGRRRLAFISGPRGNSSSAARESAFRQALSELGLAFNERHLLPGTYLEHSGFEAIEMLADGGELTNIDAIVAANDLMALGALAALHERGVAVPSRVAVVGFDDDEVAATATPPLTTVRQAIEALAERAVDVLANRVQGCPTEERHHVPVESVLRRSCGCTDADRVDSGEHVAPAPQGGPPDANYQLHRFVQMSHFLRVAGGAMGTVEETNGLERFLRLALPHLGLSTCGVFLFTDGPTVDGSSTEDQPRVLRPIASHFEPTQRDAMHHPVPDLWRVLNGAPSPNSAPISSAARLPNNADWTAALPEGARALNLLVHPLYFAKEVLGFAAFSMPMRVEDAWLLEGIAGHLSGAIANLRAREKLRQATLQAEAAATAKSEFLAIMSHELRTPLTAVLGHLDLAVKESVQGSLRQRLELAQSSARALLRSVNDVLDFSKLEADRVEVESVAFHFEDLFQQLLDTCGTAVAKKGLELIFDIDPRTPAILVGDPLRLIQVLVNLVSNATKFSRTGRIVVSLEVVQQFEDDSVTLCYSVADTGIGMSAAQLASLFQPFVQADSSTTRRYGGTGLGLAISQRLAHLLGCEIQASSILGQGSRFSFSPTLLAPRELAGSATAKTPRQRILLVEPDEEQARAMSRVLVFHGHHVYWAANETAAQRIVESTPEPFDLCFFSGSEHGPASVFPSAPYGNFPRLVRLLPLGDDTSPGGSSSLTKPALPSQLLGYCRPTATPTPHSPLALAGQTLLLVQDNPMSRDVLSAMLSSTGARVIAVETGGAAVGAVRRGTFDAVLMDVNLPDMNGCDAAKLLRTGGCQVPIIAVTADSRAQVRSDCLAAGMNDCLITPLGADALSSSIARWLGAPSPSLAVTPASENSRQEADVLFDGALGLRQVGGSAQVYRGLLERFVDEDVGPDGAAPRTLPRPEALTLVHGLVSAAGNIGARRLCGEAQRLELELRENRDVEERSWQHLEGTWKETKDAIVEYLRRAEPDPEGGTPVALDSDVLVSLKRALEDHDTAALDLLPSAVRHLRRGHPNHIVLRFEGAVRSYDFEGSLALLEGLTCAEPTK